jgi:N utilization substance protein B
MANRHLSRSIVLQSLFERDFVQKSGEKEPIQALLDRNAKEFAPGIADVDFMLLLAEGVLKKQTDLDTIIEKAAPDWPIDKIAPIDRNVLRLGLYELLFSDRKEVPAKVAINEAIELAKSFGGDSSGKFVNGVLGSVYKELGEPGKDQITKKKETPYEEMPIEHLGGAVVYTKEGHDIYLAMVHDVFGHWTLSKGHVEEGENVQQGTIREIKEELGLDIILEEELGKNEYIASHPEKGKMRKQVTYYLAKAPFDDLVLGSSGGLDDARWFKLAEIVNLNLYDDMLPIVTKSINLLLQK